LDSDEQRDEGGGCGVAVCRRGAEIVPVPTPHLAPPMRMVYTVPMAKRRVEAGQRYRDAHPGIYGRSAASDWMVETVQTDAHGIRHARLVSVADPSERKTLAAEVLVDPARFEAVDGFDGGRGRDVSKLNYVLELIGWAKSSAASVRSRLPKLR
jgi:hypothetical protein